jgi:DNA-binding helix-hairpin-helix protein with protein kinase domain
MSRIFYTTDNVIIRPGQKIGLGGEGAVCEVEDRDDLVVKLYHEPPSTEKAEKLLVLSRLGTDRLFNISAWPVDVLRGEPDGEVVGFLMKKISQAEEVHALHSPKSRLQKFPEASWAFLIYVAANIARAVAVLHDHGFVLGDLNPKNILVTKKATVYLLDCDSFQVSADGRTYRCDAGFPEYTPPELQGRPFREIDRTQEHDCFGLAVVVFQLLFLGRHPFSGRFLGTGEMPLERAIRESRFAYGVDAEARRMRQPPGTLALDAMPTPLVKLFRRAFLSAERPQPREWIEPLGALAKSLRKCSLHSGHFYYRELRDCPWCGIESRARVRLFNFSLNGADGQRGYFRLDEIWKEVETVQPPPVTLVDKSNLFKAPSPSEEVADFARERRKRLALSLLFAGVGGFLVALVTDFPVSFWLLVMTGIAAGKIAKAERAAGLPQTLFQSWQSIPDHPLVQKIQATRQQAEAMIALTEQWWRREAGNERFLDKLGELQNLKETYENLAGIRKWRLGQLEAAARKNQLDEYLDQYEVKEAEIGGVFHAVKPSLLSNGVETAADVTEQKLHELRQMPTVGPFYAERLSEWRRSLEREFVFDPVKGVPPQARIKVEKEIDALRLQLEHELSGGAYYLRQVKREIEDRRQELQPRLQEARQSLAQAERDWEEAIKRNRVIPLVVVLIIAFFFGSVWQPWSARRDRPERARSGIVAEERERTERALELYQQGTQLSREGKFEEAVPLFERAVEINSRLNAAYEELGYALYRLGRYEECVAASQAAIRLINDFGPYYNLGLAYVAQEKWAEADEALTNAVVFRDRDSWRESYSQAYYYLGLSQTRMGKVEAAIETLEIVLNDSPDLTAERFELANLYLWVGKRRAAMAQLEILKKSDLSLAQELIKLMRKHDARK